jgi:anti-sigma factor RsiW
LNKIDVGDELLVWDGCMTCDFEQDVERYHDGELDEAGRASVDAHLRTCPTCAAYLAHLKQVTDRFAMSLPRFELEMPADFPARLHRELDEVMEGSVLRLAMSFASVAAVVLIAATIGLVELQRPATQAPQSWESAAMAIQSADASAASSNGYSQLASASTFEPDVILADLSRKGAQ